jgi:hypothetical protein
VSSYKYYLIILDDCSHFLWTFPLHLKSETFSTLANFFSYVKTQFGCTIQSVQCDNGREFDNSSTHTFFLTHGVVLQMSCPYMSSQNGKAERMIHSINNIICSLLFQASLAPSFWVKGLHTATYLLNQIPTKTLAFGTSHFTLFGSHPTYTHLRVFGCACYPNMSATAPHKLAPQSSLYVFFGYSSNHKGYRCLELSTNRVLTSRHVTFDEASFPLAGSQASSTDLDFLSEFEVSIFLIGPSPADTRPDSPEVSPVAVAAPLAPATAAADLGHEVPPLPPCASREALARRAARPVAIIPMPRAAQPRMASTPAPCAASLDTASPTVAPTPSGPAPRAAPAALPAAPAPRVASLAPPTPAPCTAPADVLERASMSDCEPCSTTVDTHAKVSSTAGTPVSDPTQYLSLVGALQYLTFTRPDISYAVQQVCLHMHDPRDVHLLAVKRILRYLHGTLGHGLLLRPSTTTALLVYTDAGWAGCPDTRKSTSGYAVFLSYNLVS